MTRLSQIAVTTLLRGPALLLVPLLVPPLVPLSDV